MRKLIYLILLCIGLSACTHQDYLHLLATADSLLHTRPDSALTILYDIPSDKLHTEEERMRHALLTVEAECRNRIPQRNDSVIQVAVDYFHRIGDKHWEARGEYFRGYVLYNYMKKGSKAVKAYHQAEELAQSIGDNRLLARIYNGMAYIYQREDLYPQADSLYNKVEQMAIQMKDTVLWLEAMERQSIYLIGKGKPYYKEAEQRLLQIYEIALRSGLTLYQCSNALTLSQLYSYMHNGEQTLRFARKAAVLQPQDSSMFSKALLFIGEVFYRLGTYDSAFYYFNKSADSSELIIRSSAYMRLSDIAKKQGNTSKALEYEKLYNQYKEQYQQQSQAINIQLAEQEWKHAQKQQDMRKFIYVCLGLILCLSGMLCVLGIRRHKNRKRNQAFIEAQMQQWMNEYVRSEQTESSATEIVEAKEKHSFDFDALQVQIRETEVFRKLRRILDYYKQYDAYEEHFTIEDYYILIDTIDSYTHGFTSYLKQACAALNEEDVYFCCLHLLGLKASQIAIIVEQDRSNIYKRQKALLKDKFKITTDNKLENVLKNI